MRVVRCLVAVGPLTWLLAHCGGGGGSSSAPRDASTSETSAPDASSADASTADGPPLAIGDVVVTPSSACTLAALLTFTTSRPAVGRAHVANSSAAANTFDTPSELAPTTSHAIVLLGMRAESAMNITVTATDPQGGGVATASATFTTGAIPRAIPPFTVVQAPSPMVSPGYLVVDLNDYVGKPVAAPSGVNMAVALDQDLQVVWYQVEAGFDVEQLAWGGFASLAGTDRGWAVSSMLGDFQNYAPSLLDQVDLNHVVTPESSGLALSTGTVLQTVGGYPAPDGGTQSYAVVGANIVELALDGGSARAFASTFDLFDAHYEGDPNEFNSGGWSNTFYRDAGPTKDWIHQNAVAVDPTDDTIVASAHNLSWIYKVTRAGALVWRLGPNGDFTLPVPGDEFASQSHAAYVTPSGTIMCFDNGVGPPARPSRAVEFSLDTTAMQARVVWQYGDDFFSPIFGSAYVLPGPPDGQETVLVDDGNQLDDTSEPSIDPNNLKSVRILELTHTMPPQKLMEVDVRVPLGKWPLSKTYSGFTSWRAHKWASLYGPSGDPAAGGVVLPDGG